MVLGVVLESGGEGVRKEVNWHDEGDGFGMEGINGLSRSEMRWTWGG